LNFELIKRYFPELTDHQADQFIQLGSLYPEWNEKINVISRKDIENLYERHILHSLGIAKVIQFKPGTRILDAGTGGGFPGIPLAILFPWTHFHLIDSTAKKLSVVDAIAVEAGLDNVTTEHCRFESHYAKYDFVVSRAVSTLELMVAQTWKNVITGGSNDLPNGILYLKGGNLEGELGGMEAWGHGSRDAGKRGQGDKETGRPGDRENLVIRYKIYSLYDYFQEPFFETKSLVHLF
jgi:16S rRNA (guanine527-N7)-methyltransferase